VQNKFSEIALHLSIDFTSVSHVDMLYHYNDDGEYFYRDSEYSSDDSGIIFNKSVSDSVVSSDHSGLNTLFVEYMVEDLNPVTTLPIRSCDIPFKSDSYLEVIDVLSSELSRDLPYLITLYCRTTDNFVGETLAHGIFFCFSDTKYKYVNKYLNILTKVIHDSLHEHNLFIDIAS